MNVSLTDSLADGGVVVGLARKPPPSPGTPKDDSDKSERSFEVGDYVSLDLAHYRFAADSLGPSKKLNMKFAGNFPVVAVHRPRAVEIRLPAYASTRRPILQLPHCAHFLLVVSPMASARSSEPLTLLRATR